MFSKKNLLGASMVLYLKVVMDEEQVLSIFNDLTMKNPPFPYWKFDKIEVQFKDPPTPQMLKWKLSLGLLPTK